MLHPDPDTREFANQELLPDQRCRTFPVTDIFKELKPY
jgi:hypothetical protein